MSRDDHVVPADRAVTARRETRNYYSAYSFATRVSVDT